MAENRFKQFIPVDQQENEQTKSTNRFKMFIPDDTPLENKFNISNEPDDKSLYKRISTYIKDVSPDQLKKIEYLILLEILLFIFI